MSILENIERIGSFTSSGIYALSKTDRSGKNWGAPALTYIEEKRMERRLGRSLTDESNARPLTWGKLCEAIAFERLGFEYELSSQDTLIHPKYSFWSGSPDGTAPDTVIDIKCPITLKSFCQLVDCDSIESVRKDHKDGEKYYWQLVSNAILTESKYAELIVFMPHLKDLDKIRYHAEDFEGASWIVHADDIYLPHLVDASQYESLNTIRFEVPQSDKDLLEAKVIEAGKLLNA